ncbi:hypothetical protein GCM10027020_20520 [Nocardioides salsibiostraticola]
MPNHKFDLWTHAAAVIVEDETKPGLVVLRNEWGAKIRQDHVSENTFHFAIPTGTRLDNETVNLHEGWVLFNINNHVVVTRVSMRQATQGGADLVYESDPTLNLSGIEGNNSHARYTCVVNGQPIITGPLVLSVEATFQNEGGEIIFRGAGARQME